MAPTALLSIGATIVIAVPLLPGPAGAADAMDVVIGVVRHVEIEDVAHLRNVEAARGNVRRDQQLDFAAAETIEGCRARRLIHVAMQGDRIEFVAQQRAMKIGDFALAIAKDDGVLEIRPRNGSGGAASRAFHAGRGRS